VLRECSMSTPTRKAPTGSWYGFGLNLMRCGYDTYEGWQE
jgi:hypothetical protein